MPRSNSGGITGIVAGVIVVGVIITAVTGAVALWIPIVLGLIVGSMAVRSINK